MTTSRESASTVSATRSDGTARSANPATSGTPSSPTAGVSAAFCVCVSVSRDSRYYDSLTRWARRVCPQLAIVIPSDRSSPTRVTWKPASVSARKTSPAERATAAWYVVVNILFSFFPRHCNA